VELGPPPLPALDGAAPVVFVVLVQPVATDTTTLAITAAPWSVLTVPAASTDSKVRGRRNAGMDVAVQSHMTMPCRILLISGSLRRMSTNTAAVRTAIAVSPDGVEARLYDGMRTLPHFDPDLDVEPLPPAAAALRSAVRNADALLFSTPEYAGALPGSFKNVLDWMIGDDQRGSIYEKPVAWINASPRGAVLAHESLRLVLGYAHATLVEAACVDVPVHNTDIGVDGLVTDTTACDRIASGMAELAAAVRRGHESAVP
jgi:chromate reductase, NAD(P)H dehydrogenase (quinone)